MDGSNLRAGSVVKGADRYVALPSLVTDDTVLSVRPLVLVG
jgi:hypothetical protein